MLSFCLIYTKNNVHFQCFFFIIKISSSFTSIMDDSLPLYKEIRARSIFTITILRNPPQIMSMRLMLLVKQWGLSAWTTWYSKSTWFHLNNVRLSEDWSLLAAVGPDHMPGLLQVPTRTRYHLKAFPAFAQPWPPASIPA